MFSCIEEWQRIGQLDSSGWCPDHAVCMEWIERRALQYLENFQDVDSVYMSEDIYLQFLKDVGSKMRHSAAIQSGVATIISIVTVAGTLTVKCVPGMVNFCHVGTTTSYKELMRIQVDQVFEDIVMKNFERV